MGVNCVVHDITERKRDEEALRQRETATDTPVVRSTRRSHTLGSWETDLLTPRQFEVLELLGHGLYQKEIAQRLFVSPQTVKTHVKHIYEKLSVSDRRSAVERGRALHLLSRQ